MLKGVLCYKNVLVASLSVSFFITKSHHFLSHHKIFKAPKPGTRKSVGPSPTGSGTGTGFTTSLPAQPTFVSQEQSLKKSEFYHCTDDKPNTDMFLQRIVTFFFFF